MIGKTAHQFIETLIGGFQIVLKHLLKGTSQQAVDIGGDLEAGLSQY